MDFFDFFTLRNLLIIYYIFVVILAILYLYLGHRLLKAYSDIEVKPNIDYEDLKRCIKDTPISNTYNDAVYTYMDIYHFDEKGIESKLKTVTLFGLVPFIGFLGMFFELLDSNLFKSGHKSIAEYNRILNLYGSGYYAHIFLVCELYNIKDFEEKYLEIVSYIDKKKTYHNIISEAFKKLNEAFEPIIYEQYKKELSPKSILYDYINCFNANYKLLTQLKAKEHERQASKYTDYLDMAKKATDSNQQFISNIIKHEREGAI